LFLKAGLLAIAEYSWTYGFAFETKAAGGAGFNIEIDVSNPSYSGSAVYKLLGAGSWTNIPIASSGLSLGFQLGGLTITISGTAKATGFMSFASTTSLSNSVTNISLDSLLLRQMF
jgi:hypothetical protein